MGKPESTDDACLKCCGVCVLTSILPNHGTRSVPRILRFHKEQLRGGIVLVDPDIPKPIARAEYSQSAKGAPFASRPSFAQDRSQMHHEQPAAQDHSQMHHEQPAKKQSMAKRKKPAGHPREYAGDGSLWPRDERLSWTLWHVPRVMLRPCCFAASNSTASLSQSSAIKSHASRSSDFRASTARSRHSSAFFRYRREGIIRT